MAISRRHFLQTAVAAATATALPLLHGCKKSDDNDSEVKTELQNFFPQSVMSGDPRTNSVILWTRIDDSSESDLAVTLQVSTDATFETGVVNQSLTAMAVHDHTVKVRVTELQAYTTYYYRFVYSKDGVDSASNTGRTKTAPEASDDREIKFAYASCQDYIGRYYNTYLKLLEKDMLDSVDFIVHLGDYIYETTGDESFQSATEDRNVIFSDTKGALTVGPEGKQFQAAQSVSNYRDLYKTYRTDPVLQKMHENYPFIVTWDDHEFSDDSWMTNATYLNDAVSEQNLQRKKNSEQAYFEFMPIDHESVAGAYTTDSGAIAISEEQLYPNTKIYRDFTFGKNLHLVMSDFRTYRPDHLIPEDAFPGSIAIIEDHLKLLLGDTFAAYQSVMSPYMNGNEIKTELVNTFGSDNVWTQLIGAIALGYRSDAAKMGVMMTAQDAQAKALSILDDDAHVDVYFLQTYVLPKIVTNPTELQKIDLVSKSTKVGLSYFLMGKTGFLSEMGSRYFVVKDTFDLYALYLDKIAEKSDNAYGQEQSQWLTAQILDGTQTWKVLGSSVSFSPLALDLRKKAQGRADLPAGYEQLDAALDSVPSPFNQRFYLNVDHWDGLPSTKKNIIETAAQRKNIVSIGGDIHSHYASVLANGVFDLTSGSVSSGTFGSYLDQGLDQILAGTDFSEEQKALVSGLKPHYDVLITAASDQLITARTREHGVAVATANSQKMSVTFYNLPTVGAEGRNYVSENHYSASYATDFANDAITHTYTIEKDADSFS